MIAELRTAAKAMENDLVAIRRRLHQHAELSNKEVRTGVCLSEVLAGWGIPHRTGVCGHGVVADVGSGRTPPKVAIRADMDALPIINEEADGPGQSASPGAAHLCGHDAHMAMALGAAKILRDRLGPEQAGVRVIFQPAEELPPGGAEAMVREGALQGVESVIALHVAPLPVGVFGLREGVLTASVDRFAAVVTGKGSHGATPHLGIDPIVIAAGIIQALQTLISRSKDPGEPGVLSVCRVQAGQQYNIIPEKAVMEGTIRCFSPETRRKLLHEAERIVTGYPGIFGARGEWLVWAGHGSVVNDEALTREAAEIVREGWGENFIIRIPPQTFGEDFANYAKTCRTFMALIGAGEAATIHSPRFVLDEAVLKDGAAFLAALALRLADHDFSND